MIVPSGWTPEMGELAHALFDIGVVQFKKSKFKLHEKHPDAPISPVKLNLRTPDHPSNAGPLTDDVLKLIGQQLYIACCTDSLRFDYLAAVPNAGDPLAVALASNLTVPTPIIWLNKTEGEGKRQICGVKDPSKYTYGLRALVVDDLISRCHSKYEAIVALENEGFVVSDVLVLADYGIGGACELSMLGRGYRLISVFSITDMMSFYADTSRISRAQQQEVTIFQATCNEYFAALNSGLNI